MPVAKTVLITGCTPGGIGHSLAREFKSQGYRVFATARKTDTIKGLAEEGITTLPLEVTDLTSITALRDAVSSQTDGSLDLLVNNAGRNYTVPALHVELDEIRNTFESNVFGVMLMCQTFAPLLIKAKGTILQIGSVAGVIPYVFGSAYNASKAALHSYSNTLRVELAPFDVKVITVITGGVKSNIARTDRSLPADSIYQPIAKDYELRIRHSQSTGIPNEEYARTVVRHVMRHPKKDTLWAGGKSHLVWFVTKFLPRWVLDVALTRMFNLGKLRAGKH